MAVTGNVTKFILDGTEISVMDADARTKADNAVTASTKNAQDIKALQDLSRLSVSYNQASSTITFTTETHT